MRARDIATAKRAGILERCQAFEKDLLGVEDTVPETGLRITASISTLSSDAEKHGRRPAARRKAPRPA